MQVAAILQGELDWSAIKQEWAELLDRQDQEQQTFLRNLVENNISQREISEELGISRQRLSQLLDYDSTRRKLATSVANKRTRPTEGELRPYIAAAAEEVAKEHGFERVRPHDRDEVYERAARAYERGEKPEKHEPEPEGITCPNCGHWLGAAWL